MHGAPIAIPHGLRGFAVRAASWIGSLLALSKARLSALVAFTAFVGFVLASPRSIDWGRLLLTTAGVLLAAGGANALNQWLEAERDARMTRTRSRPLPDRRVSPRFAIGFGLLVGGAGVALLAAAVDAAVAALALCTLLVYVLLYTPLKVRSPLNTLVGGIVGALPPMIGWVAVTGRIDPAAWALAGILFAWQVPHFLALAWLYRDDYARGGFRMLPAIDPQGALTGCMVVLYLLALLPLTLLLAWLGVTGWLYAGGALAVGTLFLGTGILMELQRSNRAARRLFIASIVYLPLLLGLMLADRRPHGMTDLRLAGVATGVHAGAEEG